VSARTEPSPSAWSTCWIAPAVVVAEARPTPHTYLSVPSASTTGRVRVGSRYCAKAKDIQLLRYDRNLRAPDPKDRAVDRDAALASIAGRGSTEPVVAPAASTA